MTRTEELKHISSREFALLGLNEVAYVKPIVVNDEVNFAIFSADGTQVAVLPDREVALATIRQHDLEPASLH
ncbi:MAG TPA: DUF1150 family protein [Stellaceae bacterium]|nr:DUF1150 family protein [Stellaceae bacterium]